MSKSSFYAGSGVLLALLFATACYAQTKQPDNICRIGGKKDGFGACPFPVWRENTFDSFNLNTARTYTTYGDSRMLGARLDPGVGAVPIHAFNKCYYMDNRSEMAFFIPFRSDAEWSAFISNKPIGVSLTDCMLQANYTSIKSTSHGDHADFLVPGYSSSTVLTQVHSKSFDYFNDKPCLSGPHKDYSPCEWTEEIITEFVAFPPFWKVNVDDEQVLIKQDGEILDRLPTQP